MSLLKKINNNITLQYWFYEITLEFGGKLAKWGWGFANQSKNFNAGFVKPLLYFFLYLV